MTSREAYRPLRHSTSRFISVRGLRCHVREWGDSGSITPERAPLVMLHGWMDVAASFQFVVDALPTERCVQALDWRGFGLSDSPAADSYWFPDYLGDLDAVLDQLWFNGASAPSQIDLLGHSMGGNVAMIYAGVRPERIRRLVNLEGFGLPESRPQDAPKRYLKWLDELKTPAQLRSYDSLAAVAARLRQTNPRLRPERADWLARHWSREGADGAWHLLGDAAHKRVNPVPYQKAETLECWKRISAPLLWVEGDQASLGTPWGARYTRADFEARLAAVPNVTRQVLPDAGHMLHHDQPEALAGMLEAFLER